MIRDWILPGLLDTGPVDDRVTAIRDGLVNFYVVKGPEGLVCVDAGWRQHSVRLGFKQAGLEMRDVAAVFLTHGHWDHARGSTLFNDADVFAGGERGRMRDNQVVKVAGLEIRAIEAPGHTSDSVCYLVDGRYLFTGDALRLRRGRVVPFPTKFNHDHDAAKISIRKLAQIEGVERLLTAHTGTTTDLNTAFMDWRVWGGERL